MGNFILNQTVFITHEETDCYVTIKGQLGEKEIVLINTPDHLHRELSVEKLTNFKKTCVRLSEPGPHVFLLVLQPKDFTEQQKQRLQFILESFGDQSYKHSLVLISTPKEESSETVEMYTKDPSIRDMLQKCEHMLWHENLEPSMFLKRMDNILKENGGHMNCEFFEETQSDLSRIEGNWTQTPKILDMVRTSGRLWDLLY